MVIHLWPEKETASIRTIWPGYEYRGSKGWCISRRWIPAIRVNTTVRIASSVRCAGMIGAPNAEKAKLRTGPPAGKKIEGIGKIEKSRFGVIAGRNGRIAW